MPEHDWKVIPADNGPSVNGVPDKSPEIHVIKLKDHSTDVDATVAGPEEWEDSDQWHVDVAGQRADGFPLQVEYVGVVPSLEAGKQKVLEVLGPLWAKDRYADEVIPPTPKGGLSVRTFTLPKA